MLGPSGGGKSTLLRIIAGLESADSGQVEIEGTDATRLPPQKRNVGFVFQHYAVFKHMTVAKNVAFGLEIRKRPKAEVKAKVAEAPSSPVHLSQFAHRLPSQALRWPAPAPGAGPGARGGALGAAARRALRGARREGPQGACATGCAGCTTRCT
nr:ATP-binding cassette domain-containing protein [Nocardioides convexus]